MPWGFDLFSHAFEKDGDTFIQRDHFVCVFNSEGGQLPLCTFELNSSFLHSCWCLICWSWRGTNRWLPDLLVLHLGVTSLSSIELKTAIIDDLHQLT